MPPTDDPNAQQPMGTPATGGMPPADAPAPAAPVTPPASEPVMPPVGGPAMPGAGTPAPTPGEEVPTAPLTPGEQPAA